MNDHVEIAIIRHALDADSALALRDLFRKVRADRDSAIARCASLATDLDAARKALGEARPWVEQARADLSHIDPFKEVTTDLLAAIDAILKGGGS